MIKENIEKTKSLLAAGYNMNQIASMLMVDRVALSAALIEKPITPKDEPLFQDEPGL